MRQTQCIRSVLLAEYLLFARIKMVRKGYGKIKEIIERNCIIYGRNSCLLYTSDAADEL